MADGGFFGLEESQRLRDLHALNLLYTPAEERFDRIARLAARVLQAPMALITFIAEDTQWIKASFGFSLGSLAREHSFCGHTIKQRHTLVVPDAAEDERFAGNPLVLGKPFVRFYAGRPLHGGSVSLVGTLCVLDTRPRHLSLDDMETLRDLTAIAERELNRSGQNAFHNALVRNHDKEARRGAVDELTRMWNRTAIMELAHLECAAASIGTPLSLLLVDVDHLGEVNETFGPEVGDAVLHEAAAEIRHGLRETDLCGRYGGSTFMVLLRAGILDSRLVAERICSVVRQKMVPGMNVPMTVSIGVACAKISSPTPASLVSAADKLVRQAKAQGGDRVEIVLV